jgi:hypothetical protein
LQPCVFAIKPHTATDPTGARATVKIASNTRA